MNQDDSVECDDCGKSIHVDDALYLKITNNDKSHEEIVHCSKCDGWNFGYPWIPVCHSMWIFQFELLIPSPRDLFPLFENNEQAILNLVIDYCPKHTQLSFDVINQETFEEIKMQCKTSRCVAWKSGEECFLMNSCFSKENCENFITTFIDYCYANFNDNEYFEEEGSE